MFLADTAVVSLVLCYLINFIPGMHFRVGTDSEIVGMDESECGEVSLSLCQLEHSSKTEQVVTETPVV